jgi:hypothetical protein
MREQLGESLRVLTKPDLATKNQNGKQESSTHANCQHRVSSLFRDSPH